MLLSFCYLSLLKEKKMPEIEMMKTVLSKK